MLLTALLTCLYSIQFPYRVHPWPFQLDFSGLFELCDDILTREFSFETEGSQQSIY